jgi:hypothetical protein
MSGPEIKTFAHRADGPSLAATVLGGSGRSFLAEQRSGGMLPRCIPTMGLEISRRLEPPPDKADAPRSVGRLVAAVVIFAAGAGWFFLLH